jgi:hypothetical protein
MTNPNRLPSILSKKILANKFEEAQELINQGVNLTNDLISRAIWHDKFEAFEFLFNQGKSSQLSEDDLHSVFVNSDEPNAPKFREFFIANKANQHLQNLFSNSDYHFKTFVDHANKKMNKIHIAYINPEIKFAYNLQLDMKVVIGIQDGIHTLMKKVGQFSEFKKHLGPTSIENQLMFDEIQQKANKYQDLYNNYLQDRIALNKQLKPLQEQREKLNNHIAETIKKFTSSNNTANNKPKGQ